MKTVFLIDDDSDDREIFHEALESLALNINFQEAANGQDALFKLSEPDFKKPDLIFLDLNMPVMDGREFLVEVKKQTPFKDIPVVIYSTSSNPGDRQFANLNQAASFMTKQNSFHLLKDALQFTIASFIFGS